MQLDASCSAAQIQVAQHSPAEKRLAQVPVFVPCVKIDLQSTSRVVEKGRRKHPEGSPLLGIPAQQRSEVHCAMPEIVDFGIDGLVRHSAQQRDRAFQFGIAPTVALCKMQ